MAPGLGPRESGSGVIQFVSSATGKPQITGRYLSQAQGRDALEDDGADAMATALEKMVERVNGLAQEAGVAASFAVVVSDGSCLVTLRTATQGPPPPLYTIVAEEGAALPVTGRVVASEPLFPGAWSSLAPHSLVIFTVESDEA